MINFTTFLKKEFTENLRSKRILVISCVFLFFAITGPLLARYMAEFIGLFAGTDAAVEGLAMMLPAPHWTDAYLQFYANLGQIGAFAVILVFMGAILREKRTGTADLVLTKGLSPLAFVLSKFTVAAIITLIVTFISLAVAYIYTLLLFEEAGSIGDVLLGGVAFFMFLLVLLGITMFFSSLVKGTGTGAVLGIVAYFLLLGSTAFARIGQYSPGTLMLSPIEISFGHTPTGLIIVIFNALILTAAALAGAVRLTAVRQYS